MPVRHVVAQGETLAKIADAYGHFDWKMVYEHADNADLRELRPNPDVLMPGDVVVIPDPEPKEVSVGVDGLHRFRLEQLRQPLRLQLQDEHGEPLDGWLYTLSAGSEVFEGTVDGVIEHEIAMRVGEARLEVRDSDEACARRLAWDLKIGHLDPADTVTGVQARLNNLGFGCGAVDGDEGERTAASVRAFQAKHELSADGQLGPELFAKLEEIHGH